MTTARDEFRSNPPSSSVRLSDNFVDDDIDDMIGPVCQIADWSTSDEAGSVGRYKDDLLDNLILAARALRVREGFSVE